MGDGIKHQANFKFSWFNCFPIYHLTNCLTCLTHPKNILGIRESLRPHDFYVDMYKIVSAFSTKAKRFWKILGVLLICFSKIYSSLQPSRSSRPLVTLETYEIIHDSQMSFLFALGLLAKLTQSKLYFGNSDKTLSPHDDLASQQPRPKFIC